MRGRLAGKRIVVTGASSGIGSGVARRCAAEGAAVAIVYRRSHAAAAALVDEIAGSGGTACALACDVADPAQIPGLVEAACAQLGGIDTWCNFAGADILTGDGARAPDHEKLTRLLDTDLRGTILCAWAVADVLAQSRGSIINMSWDLALRGMGGRNPEMFAAVKAGVTGFTRALARSLAPAVRVNEIAPAGLRLHSPPPTWPPTIARRSKRPRRSGASACRQTSRQRWCFSRPTRLPSSPARP